MISPRLTTPFWQIREFLPKADAARGSAGRERIIERYGIAASRQAMPSGSVHYGDHLPPISSLPGCDDAPRGLREIPPAERWGRRRSVNLRVDARTNKILFLPSTRNRGCPALLTYWSLWEG
jgi:hypothetical protein